MANKRILVVDDDSYVREATEEILTRRAYDVDTAPEAATALRMLDEGEYDLILSDIRMPGMSGLELQNELLVRGIDLPVVIITGHGDVTLAVETMKNGAVDFLEKPFDEGKIKDLIHQHMRLAHELAQTAKLDEQINKLYSKLTTRELQVLERIVSGRLNKQIADDLNISIKTVEAHRANIMDKLQVTTVADLLKIALRKSPELAQP